MHQPTLNQSSQESANFFKNNWLDTESNPGTEPKVSIQIRSNASKQKIGKIQSNPKQESPISIKINKSLTKILGPEL